MGITKLLTRSIVKFTEKLIHCQIDVNKHKPIFYRKHPKAVSSGKSIRFYGNLIKEFTTIKPTNIFEVGAILAQDAEGFRAYFHIDPKSVYCFEPHPDLYDEIYKFYDFKTYKLGISNKVGTSEFQTVPLTSDNNGISSLRSSINHNFECNTTTIETTTLDEFIAINKIDFIDFLKIDVQGLTFEVLQGLKNSHKKVKSIQIEAEHKLMWKGQHKFEECYDLLKSWSYKLIRFTRTGVSGVQSDSSWVKELYLK